jgi:hypothetical protein
MENSNLPQTDVFDPIDKSKIAKGTSMIAMTMMMVMILAVINFM